MSNLSGPPIPERGEYIDERIDLSQYLALHPERSFLVRVEGAGMADAGIYPGDLLVAHRGSEAKSGDIVVAMVGEQVVITRLMKSSHGNLHLVSSIEIPDAPEAVVIWGVVKFSVHRL